MSFQDLEPGHVRGAPLGGRRGAGAGASQAVAAGVFQINTAVATFQRLVNTLGTPKDTPDLRDRIHKTRAHITRLVKDTSEKLKQASEADHRVEVSETDLRSKETGHVDSFSLSVRFCGAFLFCRSSLGRFSPTAAASSVFAVPVPPPPLSDATSPSSGHLFLSAATISASIAPLRVPCIPPTSLAARLRTGQIQAFSSSWCARLLTFVADDLVFSHRRRFFGCHAAPSARHVPASGTVAFRSFVALSAPSTPGDISSPHTRLPPTPLRPHAFLVTRRFESTSIQQLARHLAEYMSLPANQYSVLDAERIECVDESTFRCYVYRFRFLALEVCPVLLVRGDEEPNGCCIRLLSCKLKGSPHVEAQHDKFSVPLCAELTVGVRRELAALHLDDGQIVVHTRGAWRVKGIIQIVVHTRGAWRVKAIIEVRAR